MIDLKPRQPPGAVLGGALGERSQVCEIVLRVDLDAAVRQQQRVIAISKVSEELLAETGEVSRRIDDVAFGLGQVLENDVALQHALGGLKQQPRSDAGRRSLAGECHQNIVGETRE